MQSGPTPLNGVSPSATGQPERSAASAREANYALGILSVIYVLNYADRSVFSLLLDSIKKDFQVSDTVMGLVGGFGFAVFYSVLALPIARWGTASIAASSSPPGLRCGA